jgi:CHAD domain-containing protein
MSPATAAVLAVRDPASEVVHARLSEQLSELTRREGEVRRDVADGVHQMRVALRRLRSALATFRPLLDRDVSEPLRAELAWIAGVLGAARDAEVMAGRLQRALAAEPAELVVGPVTRHVDETLLGTYRHARASAVEAMDSPRYRLLRDQVESLVAAPPWTPLAAGPARTVLPERMRSDWKRLRRRARAAERAPDPAQRAERLHETRKAAKRARYTAETLVPVYGSDARRLAVAIKRVQTVLGEHHDSVVTQELLTRLAARAQERGEQTFTYGLLYAREQARLAATQDEYALAWHDATRKRLRRWLG